MKRKKQPIIKVSDNLLRSLWRNPIIRIFRTKNSKMRPIQPEGVTYKKYLKRVSYKNYSGFRYYKRKMGLFVKDAYLKKEMQNIHIRLANHGKGPKRIYLFYSYKKKL